jgi:hypothetical protein
MHMARFEIVTSALTIAAALTVQNAAAQAPDASPGASSTGSSPTLPAAASACAPGLVERRAGPADRVCVSPLARGRTARENAEAARHVDPHGAYGPNSCRGGFVWREAFVGDVVCVTPRTRKTVASENFAAARRLNASESERRRSGIVVP